MAAECDGYVGFCTCRGALRGGFGASLWCDQKDQMWPIFSEIKDRFMQLYHLFVKTCGKSH